MATKPIARIERVWVDGGEEFELDWQDRVVLVDYDRGADDYRLHILRRPGQ